MGGSFGLWRVRDGREGRTTKEDSPGWLVPKVLHLVAAEDRGPGIGYWDRRCVVNDRVCWGWSERT